MRKFFERLLADRAGATAIEYGLIIALVVLAMIGALHGLATTTIDMWDNVAEQVVKA